MASPAPSSIFPRLASVWRLLALRSDVDSIILELLGAFSLEKIYCEGDKETYQQLVVTLIAQLNAIFNVQRLSLPSENLQIGWYLGFIVSWEVTLRSLEFILQTVVEGRESLFGTQALRDKYLPEFLLSAIRVLTLHPKTPANQRAKDRRDRFARIHRSLERVFDSYPGSNSFLLLICKEVTDSLRSDPDSLALPPGLRYELPNLASELYPLAECLTSQKIATLVPHEGFSGWLSQFLALRDVSNFVVGASVQYVANRETRDVRLQASSARARNAVLHALDNMRLPTHLSKMDLVSTFSETFRIILPDTPSLVRRRSSQSHVDESEMDAMDSLCSKLNDRQVINRLSDREMTHNISEIMRSIALLDDPSGAFRAARPRLYAFNCEKCHLVGESQMRTMGNLNLPVDVGEKSEINLPAKSKCIACGENVTIVREVSIVRHTWEMLKPLEPNADTINVERHLPTQFQLAPPKVETEIFHPGYSNVLSGGQRGSSSRGSPERSRSIPMSPGYHGILDTPRMDSTDTSNSKEVVADIVKVDSQKSEAPFSPDLVGSPAPSQTRFEPSASIVSYEPVPPVRSRTVPVVAPPDKGKSKWRSKFGSRKESSGPLGDTSSLSSTTLESQRLDEISLKELTSASKKHSKGKGPKSINVYLSQNSTYALFWTPLSIYIWDIGTSPPTLGRAIATESTCVLAAVTKVHLTYIIGTRDHKLTLRIINLIQPSVSVVEYRIPSPWPRSIAICPKENYVVVGFDNSLVRFYSTTSAGQPRENHLHSRYHPECKECQPVDTLSFSNDGLVLLGSTRSLKSGMIQIYSWRFPFLTFEEVSTCRYQVPLHESEDGGVSSALFRSGPSGEENLVCITTWTQSGVPILVEPQGGHRTDIRTEIPFRQSRLGNRIQCAAFSPSGTELAMVNDKGDLYKISNLNSSPMDIKKLATSRELTAKSESFAMVFMTLPDEEAIVMAWADLAKGVGYIKKIPTVSSSGMGSLTSPSTSGISQVIPEAPQFELHAESRLQQEPAELVSPDTPSTFKSMKGLGLTKDSFF